MAEETLKINVATFLEKVEYNALNRTPAIGLKILVNDSLEFLEESDKKAVILLKRHLTFDPKVMCEINVVCKVMFEFEGKYNKEVVINNIKKPNGVCVDAFNIISTVIANLTFCCSGRSPLVLPPYFVEEKKS